MKKEHLWEIESLDWKIHNLENYIQEWREREPDVLHRRFLGWSEKMNKLQAKLRVYEVRLKELMSGLPFKAECFDTGSIIARSYSSKELSNSIKELGYVKVDMADHWHRPKPQPRTIIVKEQ